MTITTHSAIEIHRSPAEVWETVSDYAADTRWRKGITEMTPDIDGPPRLGTNVREVLVLGGRSYTTDTSVTGVGPGLSYRFAGTGTSGAVTGGRRVEPGAGPDTSVFTYDVEVVPTGVPAVARPVLGWWLRHSMRRDLRQLRTLLETS